jgi:alkylation response protein AidB-like acyl-CoA dehydrogenase
MGTGGGSVGKATRAMKIGIAHSARLPEGAERAHARSLLAEAAAEIHAARWMSQYGAWKADQGGQVRMESSMVKVFASEMMFRVIDRVISIIGPAAYSRKYPLESMLRNARGNRIVEGSSEIQRMLIARYIFAD